MSWQVAPIMPLLAVHDWSTLLRTFFTSRSGHAFVAGITRTKVSSTADERMRADLLLNLLDADVSVRLLMQGDIKVFGEDLPLRTVVQLNQMAF